MKAIKLKNKHLDLLSKILGENLPYQRSRIRKPFLDVLIAKIKNKETARVELLEEFSLKEEVEEEGKKVMKPKTARGQYMIDPERMTDFNTEFEKLSNEECIFDVAPSLEASMVMAHELIKATDIVTNVKAGEDDLIDEMITIFTEATAKKAGKSAKDVKPKPKV